MPRPFSISVFGCCAPPLERSHDAATALWRETVIESPAREGSGFPVATAQEPAQFAG